MSDAAKTAARAVRSTGRPDADAAEDPFALADDVPAQGVRPGIDRVPVTLR